MKFPTNILTFSYSHILFAVLAWSLLILRFGYRYGTGDQVELLPYVLYLANPFLYAKDFFIQGLHASIPNERTVMANLLLPFANHLEVVCFILQFLSTVILVLGLVRLAERFIQQKYFVWLSVLIALIPLNDYALGNVELYSECFQASGLAAAIIVWAIHFFLDRKHLIASFLVSIATFIQLLEGLDVMLVLSVILFIAVIRKEASLRVFLQFIGLYAFTAGVYLITIFIQKNVAADISNQDIFRIIFEFRHPHHFIFSAFPKLKMLVFFLLTAISLVYFFRRSTALFNFILIGLLGILVYALCVDGFHSVFIGNFQFYKVSQWIKFLGVVAVVGGIETLVKSKVSGWNYFKAEKPVLVLSAVLCWIVVLCFNAHLPYKVPFQIFRFKEGDDMISICHKAKTRTPIDAVFIQPFENTELKFYAERSSYVEFKANVKNKKFVLEWWKRLDDVYQLPTGGVLKGFALEKVADDNFYHLSFQKLDTLKQKGVTHILTRKEFPPAKGSLILQNDTYGVYQL